MIKNNDKTLTTSFNEEELFAALRDACHDLDWAPDELVVRPDFYEELKVHSAYCDYAYFENVRKNPLPTYCGVKIIIDDKLDKPFKFMRGGKEV